MSPADSSRGPCPRSAAAPAGYADDRVDDRHRDHHPAAPRRARSPTFAGPQHEERLRETRERQHRRDRDDDRVACDRAASRRRAAVGGRCPRHRRSRDRARRRPTTSRATRNERRHDGDPERRLEVARERRHRRDAPAAGRRRAPTVSSAWRSPKLAPRTVVGREVGDQRIARRAANALADAIGEARRDDPAERRRERERELRDGREPVAQHDQRLALRRNRSDSTPEKTLTISAVASAMPSMMPIASVLAPSPTAMYSGSSEWMSSDERSMHRLTTPSTQTPRGIARQAARRCSSSGATFDAACRDRQPSVTLARTTPAFSCRATSSTPLARLRRARPIRP